MSVSVEGGKGRGKSMGVDLNLVPFIDFLSCLLAFLMITAAWNQIAAVEIEQSISPPDPNQEVPDPPPPPPLTVHIRSDGYWIARKVEDGVNIPKSGEDYDVVKLEELLRKDHATLPEENMIVINTDDGVPYEEMMKVLDLSRGWFDKETKEWVYAYPKTLLAGGAPGAMPDGAAVAPAGGN
jgi:biopolymer transport protein TolR